MLFKRSPEIDDFSHYKILNSIQYAYNHILFTLQEARLKTNTMNSHVWIASLDQMQFRQFTTGECWDSDPVVSPDGQWILFLSNRTGKQQIHLIPFLGGEAQCLTDMDGYFSHPVWSLDGKYVAFIFQDKEPFSKKPQRIQNIFFKQNGIGLYYQELRHLWVLEVGTGFCRKITSENFDHFSPAWSPDSKSIAFLSNRGTRCPSSEGSQRIWLASLDGKIMKPLSEEGAIEALAWSPDGRYIAYIGHKGEKGQEQVCNHHVWIMDVKNQESRDLCPELDRPCLNLLISDTSPGSDNPKSIRWDIDGSAVYTLVSDTGRCHVYRMPLAKGKPYPVTCGDMEVYSYCLFRNRMFFLASSPYNPSEIYSIQVQSHFNAPHKEHLLSDFNFSFMKNINLSSVENFECTGEEENRVYGFLYKPFFFKSQRKYPLLFMIHGGPYFSYGMNFFHEMHYFSSKGFIVLCPNQIGSHGYGEKHTKAIYKNWGTKDYPELMKTIDYFISQGYIDEKNMGLSGGSYGGFMANWIITHTNRFAAAISQRGVCEWISFFGTSDIGISLKEELEGTPWEKIKKYIESSPLFLAHKIETPLLLIHGEKDSRTPISQSEQMYIALKCQNKNVEFLSFPEEDHNLWISRNPRNRILRLEAMSDWFMKHLQTKKYE
ncbi:MAG: S9 family peptidase [Candidatus Brocadiae bacterium]|nr:S9 family peptidase [Candidatus Brocadiia bacterium]